MHRAPVAARILLLAAVLVTTSACSGQRPATLGPTNGGLAPCASTSNCVQTGLAQPEDVEPLHLTAEWEATPEAALDRIAEVVESRPRTDVVTREGRYLHAEARSLIFRFVDDLEVLVREDGEVVVRSASRVGRSDFGVNGRRVEDLRNLLVEARIVRPRRPDSPPGP